MTQGQCGADADDHALKVLRVHHDVIEDLLVPRKRVFSRRLIHLAIIRTQRGFDCGLRGHLMGSIDTLYGEFY